MRSRSFGLRITTFGTAGVGVLLTVLLRDQVVVVGFETSLLLVPLCVRDRLAGAARDKPVHEVPIHAVRLAVATPELDQLAHDYAPCAALNAATSSAFRASRFCFARVRITSCVFTYFARVSSIHGLPSAFPARTP